MLAKRDGYMVVEHIVFADAQFMLCQSTDLVHEYVDVHGSVAQVKQFSFRMLEIVYIFGMVEAQVI